MAELIKTIIIEDEQEDLDLMINLLKAFPEIDLQSTARDVETGVAAISIHQPELIFLDINLYGRTSFEILDVISKFGLKPKVIFTTAFDNYMNKAFKYAAFDYLLKPIDRMELKSTIERYFNNLQETGFSNSYQKLSDALEKLVFNTTEGFEVVDPAEIVYLCTVKNQGYTELYQVDGSIVLITKSIGEIEPLLPDKCFFKIHRSYILNLNYVKKVNRIKGKCFLKAKDKTYEIPISRDKSKILREKLK